VTQPAGRVAAIARYPVKSLVGEQLDEVRVDVRGLERDRLWSVRDSDGRFGSGKTTRRFRRMDGLLDLSAAYDGDVPVVTFPDGRVLPGPGADLDDALSTLVGRPVSLAREGAVSHFDEGPVHLVTTGSLQTLARTVGRPVDWRRTRANFLVELDRAGFPEHAWIGRVLRFGEVELRVRDLMPRCVMVGAAQGSLPVDGDLLKSITDLSEGALGVVADVISGGSVETGAQATLA
jgi:uncharacterized protein YcbX